MGETVIKPWIYGCGIVWHLGHSHQVKVWTRNYGKINHCCMALVFGYSTNEYPAERPSPFEGGRAFGLALEQKN